MEPMRSPTSESRAVKAAPFTYGRRRQSVFGTGENLADALRAMQSVERPLSASREVRRAHGRRASRLGVHALGMTAAVHERARLGSVLDGDLSQLAAAAAAAAAAARGGRPASVSMSASASTPTASFPPLKVDPVPGCLRVLRYTRSARAWDTLACGCLPEATRLSEADNDVVAWAACFILSGDAQRGLTLLESYVVATCVVVYEVVTGALGRLPKGMNPFSKRKGTEGRTTVRDETDTPYVQRKCLERHNQVLMAWMRHRTTCAERLPTELASYDVNTARTPEAVVRQVVLMSMQLMDTVEVHRWYIVALTLFAPTEGGGSGSSSGDGAAGAESSKRRRKSSHSAAPADEHGRGAQQGKGSKHHQRNSRRNKAKKDDHANGFAAGTDRVNDTDSVFSQARSVHSTTSAATGGGDAEAPHTSASDGYRAPQNLWFRYFFALENCGRASGDAPRSSSGDGGDRPSFLAGDANNGPVTPLAASGRDCRDDAQKGEYHGLTPSPPLTSFEARSSAEQRGSSASHPGHNYRSQHHNNSSDVPESSTLRHATAAGRATPVVVDTAVPTRRSTPSVGPPMHASVSTTDFRRDSGQKAPTNGLPPPAGKLARTLSWFRERGKSTTSQNGARDAVGGAMATGAEPFTASAPTWHLRATASLDQEQTCSLLLSYLEEWDVYFITAMTAFYTHHYRTSMMAASRFLLWADAHDGGAAASSAHLPSARHRSGFAPSPTRRRGAADAAGGSPLHAVPGLQGYQRRFALFLRAWAALQIGERLQSGKDIIALLDEPEGSLPYHVGCALSLYGLPLPQAAESVLAASHEFTNATVKAAAGPGAPPVTSFTSSVQAYLYLLTEAVHATTLLQLGLVHGAAEVAALALARVEACALTEEDTLPLAALRDVRVVAATATEDANAILDVPLSSHRLVYLAVCPAFFGGLCGSGIRVKAQSATHRTLYPQNLPLYASTRQVIPFHMNRAMFLFHAGQVESAWDDACCAVAAVDEVVGSVEFAFSDCFPLRVYHFAVAVGLRLLETLLTADLEAAKACLANPADQAAVDEKDVRLQEDELLSKEIVHICQDIVQRMQHFFPHSRVTELCRAQIAIVCGGKDYLAQAVALSRRYPYSPATQNVLTLALYFDHHIPEAVDNAQKNLQTFPHSSEVIYIHRTLQKKHVTYNFNYRKLLPTRYKPGSHDRVFTKRMIIVLILLAANLIILCLTVFVNVPTVRDMPGGLRYLAVRMQLPTVAPLFVAAIFVIHAIVAAVTTKNLIATLLTDLFFVNTPLNRALFCLRCIPLVNLVNALLVSVLGNNFLFESGSATFVLYFFLGILFVPFTTRIWFLPSIDEPDVGFMSWLAILSVDIVVAIFVVVPHILAAFLEPYMLVLFYFFAPTERPSSERGFQPPSSSIRRRLLLHAHDSATMPPRFTAGSGSHFIHIIVLKWLYAWSHCNMETRFLAEAQLEAECYRVFPLFDGETAAMLYAHVPQAPLCAAITATEEARPAADGAAAASQPPTPALSAQEVAEAAGTTSPTTPTIHNVRRRRPRRTSLSEPSSAFSPSSSSSSSSYATASSGSTGSDSDDSLSPGNIAASDTGRTHDSTTDLDATLLVGARTVDAMRQLLNRTARDRPSAMRHTASFVRPNTLHAFGSVFAGSSSGGRPAPPRTRSSTSSSSSSSSGSGGSGTNSGGARQLDEGRDVGRGGGQAANNMNSGLEFSEDVFGRRVEAPSAASPSSRTSSSRGSSNSSDAGSEIVSYHGDADLNLAHMRSGAPLYANNNGGGGGAHPATLTNANELYTDEYAAQNGFGWYSYEATSGATNSTTPNPPSHYNPSAFDF